MKLLIPALLVFLGLNDVVAQPRPGQDLPKFMGREVTMTVPELDADGFFPKGPASVCVEGPPQRQCYTAPKGFGIDPKVALVQVEKDIPALLFSVASGGVSGFGIHFALLQPDAGKSLENFFPLDLSVSNQSQHAFWNDSTISEAPIFLTADFVWGPDESHYVAHRYIISAYVWRSNSIVDEMSYYLEDRYMTIRKYDLDANADILSTEEAGDPRTPRDRVKAETERQKRGTPR